VDVYIINLDRHLERWRRLCDLLADPRLRLHRVGAMDGQRLRERPEPAAPRPGALPAGRTVLTRYEIACVLSHRQAWRTFLQTDARRCVVLEDDVYIGDRFADFVCSDELGSTQFDIIKLEAFMPHVAIDKRVTACADERKISRLLSYNPGAAGYMLTRAAATRLLTLSRNAPDGADTIVFNLEKYQFFGLPQFQIGQVIPAPIIQHHLKTDAPANPLLDSYIAVHRGVRVKRSPMTFAKLRRELSRPLRDLQYALARTTVEFR
jgi:glycosyl transferase family 25